MSTLTIAVADYFKPEVALVAVGQNLLNPGQQKTAGSVKSKTQPLSRSSTPKPAPLMATLSMADLSDLSVLPDSPILCSAPSLGGAFTPTQKILSAKAESKDDSSTGALWVRMKPVTGSKANASVPSFVPAPKPAISHKPAISTEISKMPEANATTIIKVKPPQNEYVCVDEVKQVIQAARPGWTIPSVDILKPIAGNNTLRAAIAAKSAASFIDLSATKLVPAVSSLPVTAESALPANAPPLRKLKSSLKVSSLTKLYSTSNISPKSVRFASHLANVKTFDGRDSPSTVSLQNSPSGSPTYSFASRDYFSVRHNFTDLTFSDDDVSSDSDMEVYQEFTKDKHYKITRSNFSAPKNIYDKRDRPVYLQQASLSTDKKLLILTIMCQNLAFEKKLSVKLTLNNWNSVLIFNNYTYMKLFSSVNFDQFQFVIPFSHFPSSINPQFCIRYDVNNTTYWDNNNDKNYAFSLSAVQEVAMDSSSFFNTSKPVNQSQKSTATFSNFTPSFSANTFIGAANAATNASVKSSTSMSSTRTLPSTVPSAANKTTSAVASKASTFTNVSSSATNNAAASYTYSKTNYSELINKLLEAKSELDNNTQKITAGSVSSQRPALVHAHSMSSIPSASSSITGPKFSQSYLSRRAPSMVAPTPAPAPQMSSVTSVTPITQVKATASKPLPISRSSSASTIASSNDFSDTKFNSSSYAALLANYCFNGNDAAMGSCPMESLAGSRASSSSSVNSDFMGPSLATFHSLSDSFHV
ncbi:hypothetical protein PUMCH_002021 [Australozyma saopauloensis]|uniref:CBM21 domain-containing protein n=1 Tax=Australozyma saopauloensis TaxID=291208 RepID=A0AAX4H9Z1_9ASCO|nr:hypothetical protein PUMCH_002021 [[Candida] saopauloensis]